MGHAKTGASPERRAFTDDRHWDKSPLERPTQDDLDTYRKCTYLSRYLKMRDGVDIATDVMLPRKRGDATTVDRQPCVLYQTRYMRGVHLRWPLSRYFNGRPLDLINIEMKKALLGAGFGLVTIDVRGTGASFGQWTLPWSHAERADSLEVVSWIAAQPWCNGQVLLCGMSYEATAAMFTIAGHHPAVVGAILQFPFWDLCGDIALPGGVANRSFVEEWGMFCRCMDTNDFLRLPLHTGPPLKLLFKGCAPVVDPGALRGAENGEQPAAVQPRGCSPCCAGRVGCSSPAAAGGGAGDAAARGIGNNLFLVRRLRRLQGSAMPPLDKRPH